MTRPDPIDCNDCIWSMQDAFVPTLCPHEEVLWKAFNYPLSMAVSHNTQFTQLNITIFWTNTTVSDHVIRYYIVLICYILQGGSFLCALLMFYLLRKMHGVGMQEKRARGVVSSARWSHGRPMDWDGLEDSQAFWATSGRNTHISVLHHIVFLFSFLALQCILDCTIL